jgi:hypothetical protein
LRQITIPKIQAILFTTYCKFKYKSNRITKHTEKVKEEEEEEEEEEAVSKFTTLKPNYMCI